MLSQALMAQKSPGGLLSKPPSSDPYRGDKALGELVRADAGMRPVLGEEAGWGGPAHTSLSLSAHTRDPASMEG